MQEARPNNLQRDLGVHNTRLYNRVKLLESTNAELRNQIKDLQKDNDLLSKKLMYLVKAPKFSGTEDFDVFATQVGYLARNFWDHNLTEEEQVIHLSFSLEGEAARIYARTCREGSPHVLSLDSFLQFLRKEISQDACFESDYEKLQKLGLKSYRVFEYDYHFQELIKGRQYTEKQLAELYLVGLNPQISDEIEFEGLHDTLEETRNRALALEKLQLCSESAELTEIRPALPFSRARGKLPEEERQRRIQLNLCFYCASDEHRIGACPYTKPATRNRGSPHSSLLDSPLSIPSSSSSRTDPWQEIICPEIRPSRSDADSDYFTRNDLINLSQRVNGMDISVGQGRNRQLPKRSDGGSSTSSRAASEKHFGKVLALTEMSFYHNKMGRNTTDGAFS